MNYGAKIRNIPYINRNRAEKVAMFNEKPSAKSRKNGRWPKGKSKSGAEGESLKLLKESDAIFSLGSSKNTVSAEFLFHKSVILIIVSRSNRKMPRYYFS
jgi:hypothetical protein